MKIWLNEVLRSKDFWISFSVAVIFLLAGKLATIAIRLSRQVWQSHQSYSVSGFWLGECILGSCGGALIEIWRFVQRQDQIKLTLFVYHPPEIAPSAETATAGSRIEHFVGSGVFRVSYLSAIYYSARRDSYESGVLALKLSNHRLSGKYAQYDLGHPNEKFCDGKYAIARVRLPVLEASKMLLGRPPLRGYGEAKTMYEQSCAEKKSAAA